MLTSTDRILTTHVDSLPRNLAATRHAIDSQDTANVLEPLAHIPAHRSDGRTSTAGELPLLGPQDDAGCLAPRQQAARLLGVADRKIGHLGAPACLATKADRLDPRFAGIG